MTALALVVICTLSVAGTSLLVSSYSERQSRESDYELAMQLAEAGINYEMRYVDTHLTSSPAGHLYGSAYSGTVTGVSGSFSVYVENTDGTTNWAPPSAMKVISTGTVGTISRTVSVVCTTSSTGTPLFNDNYAVFGYQSILFTQASNAIVGPMGANGPLPSGHSYSIGTQNGGVGNASSSTGYPLVLAGGATLIPGNSVNPNYTNNPSQIETLASPVQWPTVDTIVAATFPAGWSTLSSSSAISNQWAQVRAFSTQSPTVSPSTTKPAVTVAGSTTLNDSLLKQQYANDGQPMNALIFPPGNYYFTSVSLNTTNGYSGPAPILYFDTAALSTGGTPGPVVFWIGGTSTSNDLMDLTCYYTSPTAATWAQDSRIYYDKPANFTITGNSDYGGVYAVRAANNTSITPATVTLTQNTKITGAVYADNVVMTGGANVDLPTTAMNNSSDYLMGGGTGPYGFSGNWTELPATGAAVFVDGTSR